MSVSVKFRNPGAGISEEFSMEFVPSTPKAFLSELSGLLVEREKQVDFSRYVVNLNLVYEQDNNREKVNLDINQGNYNQEVISSTKNDIPLSRIRVVSSPGTKDMGSLEDSDDIISNLEDIATDLSDLREDLIECSYLDIKGELRDAIDNIDNIKMQLEKQPVSKPKTEREKLMQMSFEQLSEMCFDRGLEISSQQTKEEVVNMLIG